MKLGFLNPISVQLQTDILNLDNLSYNGGGGNDTTDKFFLLSIDEAKNYFMSDEDRMASVTWYAHKQGAFADDKYSVADGGWAGWSWLRSPGLNGICAATVGRDGKIYDQGSYVYTSAGTVRPAIWVKL